MAFKQYTDIALVISEFKLNYQEAAFVTPTAFAISQTFLDEFNFVEQYIDTRASEFAVCENVLYPILKEVYKSYVERLALWSHKTIRYDKKLTGEPDYLLATRSEQGKVVMGRPLVLVVEAKKNDFDKGWGQCAAELVAAQKLNGDPAFPVYGIVSDGKVWEFGQLRENVFTKHKPLIFTANLPEVFGAIDFVLKVIVAALPKFQAAPVGNNTGK